MVKFCPMCGKPLLSENDDYCPGCKKKLQFENAAFCPSCGERIQPTPLTGELRKPIFAAILSFFFIGWGQWYNGKTWEGLKFIGLFLVFYFLLWINSSMAPIRQLGLLIWIILVIVIIALWVYGMYDAYKTAIRINNREEKFSDKSRLFWLPLEIYVIVVLLAVTFAFVFYIAKSVLFF